MKSKLALIRFWYRLLSVVSPQLAARKALKLFQTVQNRKIRDREKAFYAAANRFVAEWEKEDITCYELGNPGGKLVFLVHGWDSNAGSMAKIGFELARRGYHVVSFNLPAHGTSTLKRNNMYLSAEAFAAVVHRMRPSEPFSVVSHSFGSAVTTYMLEKYGFETDQLVFLTTPNRLQVVFDEFRDLVKLNANVMGLLTNRAGRMIGEPVANIAVSSKIQRVKYNHLLLIHDRHDKVIPFSFSAAVHEAAKGSELLELEKVGHYRMLWNEEVLEAVSARFPEKELISTRKERA